MDEAVLSPEATVISRCWSSPYAKFQSGASHGYGGRRSASHGYASRPSYSQRSHNGISSPPTVMLCAIPGAGGWPPAPDPPPGANGGQLNTPACVKVVVLATRGMIAGERCPWRVWPQRRTILHDIRGLRLARPAQDHIRSFDRNPQIWHRL